MSVSQNDTATPQLHSVSFRVILSYVSDWIILIAVGIASYIVGDLEPHKRPFSLVDPNISLPYSEAEAVPLWLLAILIGAFPFLAILVITFVFVPGTTTPRHTPAAVIWRCKLWEFHISIMGLVAANIIAFFFTQGMKNLFGKPRPDFLDRCQPDVDRAGEHAVGGFPGESISSHLYYASICQQEDLHILDDGFRSYPSGHSSASAAGLVYLSLFLASKFVVVIPFVLPGVPFKAILHYAFPSHMVIADPLHDRLKDSGDPFSVSSKPVYGRQTHHGAKIQSLRSQAAAPPLYLLAVVLAPFALSIYISASRWFDFRHHGFDILFGYLIGLIAAVYCFRIYHLPISQGAGWAWGPRSHDRAFWAGVGRMGYTYHPMETADSLAEVDRGHRMRSSEVDYGHQEASTHPSLSHKPTNTSNGDGPGPYNSLSHGSHAHAATGQTPSASHTSFTGAKSRDDHFDLEMQWIKGRS